MWSKTEAGRQEIQARSLVTARGRRTLLLLIDGKRAEAELLAAVRGITAADFDALATLGLIEAPGATAADSAKVAQAAERVHLEPAVQASARVDAAGAPPAPPSSHAAFTKTLTELIARELGLRGFALTLAVEKANSLDELRAVAERVVAAIGDRKGVAQAAAARRALYGEPPS